MVLTLNPKIYNNIFIRVNECNRRHRKVEKSLGSRFIGKGQPGGAKGVPKSIQLGTGHQKYLLHHCLPQVPNFQATFTNVLAVELLSPVQYYDDRDPFEIVPRNLSEIYEIGAK